MRLAVVFPVQVFFDGSHYTTSSYFHYQLSHLQTYLGEIDLIVLLKKSLNEKRTESIDSERIHVHGLPFSKNGWELHSINLPQMILALARLFKKKRREWDVLLIYDSNIITELSCMMAKAFKIPAILYCGGRIDLSKLEKAKSKGFPERILRNVGIICHKAAFSLLARKTPLIVTGSELYNYYRDKNFRVYKIISTTASEEWIEEKVPCEGKRHDQSFRVLTVCQVSPIKGLEYLIEAAANLRSADINALLQIVGPAHDEHYLASLTQRIDRLGLNNAVDFVGPIEHGELAQYYEKADVFVLPSLCEGIPKVIPEAMAKALPIIATKVGGLHELVTDGKEGILVEPADVEGLTTAMKTLATDHRLCEQMAGASLSKAPQFTVEVQMERLARIIKGIRASFINSS